MVTLKAAANDEWFFQKIFSDGDFIAAGQLMIPPKSNKPSKGTKDNTYVRLTLWRLYATLAHAMH
jgi:centromere protein C